MAKLALLDGVGPTVPSALLGEWPPPLTEAEVKEYFSFLTAERRALHGFDAPWAARAEAEWARWVGVKHAKVVNQGTSALWTAMQALGLGPGDEVICPAYTYWATALPIIYCNAVPVFVDVDPILGTVDPGAIEAAITPSTKVVVPVHVYGMPADLAPVLAIARRHGLRVVEDACQAHGTLYEGRMAGSFGDFGCWSLNRSKQLTCGDGGFVATDSAELDQAVRDTQIMLFSRGPQRYEHSQLGLSTRTTELSNALTVASLQHLDEWNGVRRSLGSALIEGLAAIPGFRGPAVPAYADPVWWQFPVKFAPEQLGLDCSAGEWKHAAMAALHAEGVPGGDWQPVPVPYQPYFQELGGYAGTGCPWACPLVGDSAERLERIRENYRIGGFPGAERFIDETAFLGGIFPPNDGRLIEWYVAAFAKVSERAHEVLEAWRSKQGKAE
ncbi:MAG: DegT/DnrJ/EryC1/StrS family aminotransferase [Candidatus Latescibacterota bacterium]|jgi:dTDP-4-amino-4,6-dideoxygalactose transaminase